MGEGGQSEVTLREVAREAGVSQATASRVLNGSARRVGDGLSERVVAAARRLNYAANAQAQAVARGRSNVVGLIVHDISDPYFSAIASGVAEAAEAKGLLMMLGSTMGSPERELQYLTALRGQRGRAVILAGSRVEDREQLVALAEEARAFERSGGRLAAISQARVLVDTVVPENRAGARELALALADRGYRRFGVLAGPPKLLTARDRYRGFIEGATQRGCPSPKAVHGEFTRDGGYAALDELLTLHPEVDCVFAVNDVMAMGAMAACRARGLALPQDLALAGFDDIPTLRDVDPPLTTVRLPLAELGAEAVRLVLAPPAASPRRLRVRGEVVVRRSTPDRTA